jgi:tRNA A-37 threonylcarbamoyl transferase component Bud32
VRELLERGCYFLALTLGRLLRSARYSKTRVLGHDGERYVRKSRAFYAPFLVWLGGPLVRILDTGVRVLPRRDWQEREQRIYRSLGRAPVRTDADGALLLPYLAGETLAALLDDSARAESVRTRAIELSVAALVRFHAQGLTHGDAMAENVMVDLETGVAHWFDFETIHESNRSTAWGRADDVRALLATCLVRTGTEKLAGVVQMILAGYGDEQVTRLLVPSFSSVFRRPLPFHLGQAPMPWPYFREVGRLLRNLSDATARGTHAETDHL